MTLNRTNWQLGKTSLNILVLGIAIPILWTILEKKGNSNTLERKTILSQFVSLFGLDSILYRTADREFIGKTWLEWLSKEGIDFRIRICQNRQIANARGKLVQAQRLFTNLRLKQGLVIAKGRRMWGLELYVSGMRLAGGEYLIVVAPTYTATAIEDYGKRWEIETLFGCLKSRSFRLEETHVTEPERLKKLIALLSL